MASKMMVRQGDLLLVRVSEETLPTSARKVPRRSDGRIVLAEGEQTGHSHTVTADRAELLFVEAETIAARRWLQISGDEPVALQHQEHATIWLDTGVWEVRRQREYAPEEIRVVAD